MPDSFTQKVTECVEIIGKGVFTTKDNKFLRDMKRELKDPDFRLTGPQERYIDGLYKKACASPY